MVRVVGIGLGQKKNPAHCCEAEGGWRPRVTVPAACLGLMILRLTPWQHCCSQGHWEPFLESPSLHTCQKARRFLENSRTPHFPSMALAALSSLCPLRNKLPVLPEGQTMEFLCEGPLRNEPACRQPGMWRAGLSFLAGLPAKATLRAASHLVPLLRRERPHGPPMDCMDGNGLSLGNPRLLCKQPPSGQ